MSKLRTIPLSSAHAIIMSNCHKSSFQESLQLDPRLFPFHSWTLAIASNLLLTYLHLPKSTILICHIQFDLSITFIIFLSYLKAFTKFNYLESNLVSLALYSRLEPFTFLFIFSSMHILLKSYTVIPTFFPSVFTLLEIHHMYRHTYFSWAQLSRITSSL